MDFVAIAVIGLCARKVKIDNVLNIAKNLVYSGWMYLATLVIMHSPIWLDQAIAPDFSSGDA
jgi:hypothetical protein